MPLCGKCHREAPAGALFCSFCGGSIKPETAAGEAVDPLIGQTVAQKYFIHQLLGHGGMGDVYKATHLTLDRPVVLKLLKKQFNTDPSLVQRFHREARASSRLNHPNSITIIDFGQSDDGTLFMAMEYLAGRSLERIVADEHPLAEPRVIHIVAQILAALGEAHSLGIIHRDLKPANVMIEPRRDEPDFVKVLDFGIAKLNEPGAGGAGLTQAGIVCGTPGYMSPEQVRGEELDPRSDIYAVGVILYECLTGVLPFESDTPMGLVTKHLVEDPPPIAVRRPGTLVSQELEGVIMKALARDREQRFASADEMRASLLACGTPMAAPMRPTPLPSSTMIFDPASIGGAGARRAQTGSGRPVTDPSRAARPTPGRSFTEALPATPGELAEEAPPPVAARPVSSARLGAPAARPPTPVQKTPPPAPRAALGKTPAPVRKTQTPARKTPMPAGRPPTGPGRSAQRTPAPRHEMDELEEEAAAEAPAAAPSSALKGKMPIIAGAGAAAVVLVALVIWGLTRSPSTPKPTPAPPPVVQARTEPVVPPVPPPTPAQPEPQPPVATPPPTARTEPTVVVRAEPPVPEPAKPRTETPPPPRVHHPKTVASTSTGASKGVRFVKSELNSIPTPPAASGDGVLAVVATPWAVVTIDGNEVGETPREIQLGAGTYRVKASHPALGAREQMVTIKPGKRQLWKPTFAN
jgi:serine/threonine protein kinase